MKRKLTLILISLVTILCLTDCRKKVALKHMAREKPNIILIFTDDLDFDEVNFYPAKDYPSHTGAYLNGLKNYDPDGYFPNPKQLMPNIDKLAKEGMVYTHFYTTSSVCTPVRYAIFTGNYATRSLFFQKNFPPGTNANIVWNTYLTPEEDNIAREMKKLGYQTAMIGKWHNGFNGKPFEYPRNRTDFDDTSKTRIIKEYYKKLQDFLTREIGFDYADALHYDNPAIVNLEWITQKAVHFIKDNKDKPFFLYIAPPLPHCQYRDPVESDPRLTPAGWLDKKPTEQPDLASARRKIRSNFFQGRKVMGTWLDDHFGAIIKALKECGLDQNTLVIITSDQQTRGKFSCYETCRVPFIAWWPGVIPAGSTTDFFAADIDLFPTFIELAGGKAPKTDGKSFASYLKSQKMPDNPRKYLLLQIAYSRAVVTPEWKYIANRPPEDVVKKMNDEAAKCRKDGTLRFIGWDGEKGDMPGHKLWATKFGNDYFFPCFFDPDQLYNLKTDMFEQKNLAYNKDYALQLTQMKAYLAEVLKTLPHKFGEFTD